ncbi:MAG: hypothetical protein H6735_33650 [Alphaproteobacteria bacterium]|nr:hypothetical protein [Alphaproteobacteria bacterium]
MSDDPLLEELDLDVPRPPRGMAPPIVLGLLAVTFALGFVTGGWTATEKPSEEPVAVVQPASPAAEAPAPVAAAPDTTPVATTPVAAVEPPPKRARPRRPSSPPPASPEPPPVAPASPEPPKASLRSRPPPPAATVRSGPRSG